MATESSAVAQFINLVQQERLEEVSPSPRAVAVPPQRPGRRRSIVLGAGVLLLAGAALAGGYALAQRQLADAGPALAAAAPAEEPAPAAVAEVPAPEPPPTATAATAAVAPPAELIAQTGFDVVVEPAGATVLLDGAEIGRAPLRVRNLLPGAHVLGVAGPEGYFGQHMEITLRPGVAETFEIELSRVADVVAAIGDDHVEEVEPEADEPQADEPRDRRAERARARKRRRARRRAARQRRRQPAAEVSLPRVEGAAGTLMLGSKPPCDIYIDGRPTGLKTPQRGIELSPGSHTVTLINGTHGLKKRFRVRVVAGKTTRAIQDFTGEL